MGKYCVHGGKRLYGEIDISGSKNAVLPILAATVLNSSQSIIHNCPNILDAETMIQILKSVGCKVKRDKNTITVDSKYANSYKVPEKYVKEMRSSIIFLGSLIGRFKKTVVTYPGGCELGPRPIDLHLKALKQMGISIKEEDGFIICETDRIVGADICLDFPSVGATENIMLTAVLADGKTVINNSAKEPEIVDLQNFLISMGAKIHGAGTDTIYVDGVKSLHGTEYRVMPDRIVAGTFLAAAAITGGEISINSIDIDDIYSVVSKFEECGCEILKYKNSLSLKSPNILKPVNIKTEPYPGFPTDMQPQIVALMTLANGTSTVIETVFESRYKYVSELAKMGANILTDGKRATVNGVDRLKGADVAAFDLRGGAALIVAALAADGKTVITNSKHVERGYESIESTLRGLGADIEFIG